MNKRSFLWMLSRARVIAFLIVVAHTVGMQTGLSGAGGRYRQTGLEATTNLAAPVWSPLQTITLNNGSSRFSESLRAGVASRFYRLGIP